MSKTVDLEYPKKLNICFNRARNKKISGNVVNDYILLKRKILGIIQLVTMKLLN